MRKIKKISLYNHQIEALNLTRNMDNVAYFHDMGLGKTFVGSERMKYINNKINIVVCQKSKILDWINHFNTYYNIATFNLSKTKDFEDFKSCNTQKVGVINYDLLFRRPDLAENKDFTLLLDESSLIQNETSKRTKFIMKLKFKNIILLSGTPTGGKYEKLYSQLKLLGYKKLKSEYWDLYVIWFSMNIGYFAIKKVTGYKHVKELKNEMRKLGCHFLKSKDVFDLPLQQFNVVNCNITSEYKIFRKNNILEAFDKEFIGDTPLSQMLNERYLTGAFNKHKIKELNELLEATDDRVIIFYNFNVEKEAIKKILNNRPISEISGDIKNLNNYDEYDNSILLIQYQAGAMGLNLQKANKIIYFSLPLSSELFEQSKKRIHRIGQDKLCFYYILLCSKSIDENIYNTLLKRRDYTNNLFEENYDK